MAIGFFIGAAVMAVGGITEIFFGVKAEGQKLEDIAEPLTAVGEQDDEAARERRESGEMTRQELARRVNARSWGPGRFRGAVADALAEGAARRVGRDRVGPPEASG